MANFLRFLWVSFQIADICDQICDEDIRTVINKLPRDLTGTYERALHRINRSNKTTIAQKVFRWVLAAKRPLNLEELCEAVVVEPCQNFLRPGQRINNVKLLLPWCGNLLIQDEEEDFVHFAHHTVKQFLLSQHSATDLQYFSFDLMETDYEAGEICCTYLNLDNFKNQISTTSNGRLNMDVTAVIGAALPVDQTPAFMRSWMKKRRPNNFDLEDWLSPKTREGTQQQQHADYPFLTYASKYWLSHTTMFSEASSRTYNLFEHLLKTEKTLGIRNWSSSRLKQYVTDHSHWSLLAWKWNRYKNGVDQPETIDELSEHWKSSTFVKEHTRLLLLAAASPYDKATTIVSQAGLWYNTDGAINTVAENGDFGLLQRLLSVHVPERFEKPRPDINFALRSAVRSGHTGVVIRLLDVKSSDLSPAPLDLTALISATISKKVIFGSRLCEKVLQLKTSRQRFTEAIGAENASKLQRLLKSGVEVNAVVDGHTALQKAVSRGWYQGVDILIDWHADVGAGAGTAQGTVLQHAALHGHFIIVRQLCQAYDTWINHGDGEFGMQQQKRKAYGAAMLDTRTFRGLTALDLLKERMRSDLGSNAVFRNIYKHLLRNGFRTHREIDFVNGMVEASSIHITEETSVEISPAETVSHTPSGVSIWSDMIHPT